MSASAAISRFNDLGHAIEERFRRANYNARIFPALAEEALASADLPAHVAPLDIIRWIVETPVMPKQLDVTTRFGDVAVTVFHGPRFVVDVYYWLDGTTAIHQHAFSGAFQVLAGGSVLTRFDFHETHVINEHFALGTLTTAEVELLSRGDVRQIPPGREYVHSLFHLLRPSISVVVRTGIPSAMPQFSYDPPFVAYDPSHRNPEQIKKTSAVRMLLSTKDPEADAIIGDLVCDADFQTAYLALTEAYRHFRPNNRFDALFNRTRGLERFGALLERARSVHGDLVDVIRPVLDEDERLRIVRSRRNAISDEGLRFLLALLLTVPEKHHVLRLVRQRVPDRDAVDVVVEWVDQLAHVKAFDSQEANILGIDGFGPAHLTALDHALRDRVESADMPFMLQMDASAVVGTLTRGASHLEEARS
jgi:hypothetical protein